MHPEIHLNCVGILLAVVASFFFGWLWYGLLFGKKWAALMKFPTDCKPEPKKMMYSMALGLLGTFLTAYVLAHSVAVWRPSAWGVGPDASCCTYGFFGGFLLWKEHLGWHQYLGAWPQGT